MRVKRSCSVLFSLRFIAIEQLRLHREDSLRVLISSEKVYFLGRSDPDRDNIVLEVPYGDLYHCRSIHNGRSKCSFFGQDFPSGRKAGPCQTLTGREFD